MIDNKENVNFTVFYISKKCHKRKLKIFDNYDDAELFYDKVSLLDITETIHYGITNRDKRPPLNKLYSGFSKKWNKKHLKSYKNVFHSIRAFSRYDVSINFDYNSHFAYIIKRKLDKGKIHTIDFLEIHKRIQKIENYLSKFYIIKLLNLKFKTEYRYYRMYNKYLDLN